jgi:hypothetical protein
MAKTLCDWSKGKIEKHADKLLELVLDPSFFCRNCARVANTPKVLCEPRRLPAVAPSGEGTPDTIAAKKSAAERA